MPFETLVDKHGRPLSQLWPEVSKFQQVQDLLDRNRLLVAEISHNHQLGTHSALERNVPMLQELNQNIARVLQLYKNAADTFAACFDMPTSRGEGNSKAEGSGAASAVMSESGNPSVHPFQ
jgi:NAD(P)H-dependent flavin oxidoreductase YrpB (nitropropane dioxygenase family)